jgi:hypothetical protein
MSDLLPCRFLDATVPIVASDVLHAYLQRVLAPEGFRLVAFDGIEHALALPVSSGPLLLDARSIELPEAKRRLTSHVVSGSGGSKLPVLLLVTSGGRPDDLYAIGRSADVRMVALPSEEAYLRILIVRSRFWNWTHEIEAQISAATQVHTLLRGGLRWILRIHVDSSAAVSNPLVPELQAIAAGLHCSPGTLSRVNRSSGRILRPIADAWIALQILLFHEVEGRTWESLALAAGYEGVSGVSQLMLRVYGRRPRRLSGSGVELGLRRIEELIGQVLAKDSPP